MRSIKSKILLLTLVPIGLVLIGIGGLTVYSKYHTEKQLLVDRLDSYRALLESGDISFDSSQDKNKLEALLSEKVEFAEILREDYSVVYSTENSASALLEEGDKADVDDAFRGIETTRTITRNGKSAFMITTPLIVNGRIVAVLHQALSNELSNQRVVQYVVYVFLLTMAGIVICYLLISILLNNVVLKHIYTLQNATIEMQKGNLTTKISVHTDDEIGNFAKSFEAMRSEVHDARLKLEEYNRQLEGQVRERTVELEVKLDELSRMNRLMTGRELKMIELKKMIRELEERIAPKQG